MILLSVQDIVIREKWKELLPWKTFHNSVTSFCFEIRTYLDRTNTWRVFHVEMTWEWSFPRRFNVEYTWCVCRGWFHPALKVVCRFQNWKKAFFQKSEKFGCSFIKNEYSPITCKTPLFPACLKTVLNCFKACFKLHQNWKKWGKIT